MAIFETLTLRLGASIGTALLKSWIGDSEIVADVGSTAGELLAKAGLTFTEQRRITRELDEATEAIAERLTTFFEAEAFSSVLEEEIEAAAIAAAATVDVGFSDPTIALKADLDAQQLERRLRTESPTAARDHHLQPTATRLYDIALSETCAYLVAMVENLPRFNSAAFAEVLIRERAIIDKLEEALLHLPSTDVDKALEFGTSYLREVARRFDLLQLFGLSGDTEASRYRLSVAYMTLTAATNRSLAEGASEGISDKSRGALEMGNAAEAANAEDEEDDYNVVRVDRLMSSTRRLLIRGDAGSGKTTLLQWLAVNAARRSFTNDLEWLNGCVPFMIQLRRYADSSLPEPSQFVRSANSTFVDAAPSGWVAQVLGEGRGIVLIDGVDELRADRRAEVHDWLDDLLHAYPRSTYVVTSRPPAVEEGWLSESDFDHCVLEPMGLQDVDEFIVHWHEAISSTASEDEALHIAARRGELKRVVRQNAPLRRLATNPLLCAMLCALNRRDEAQLPEERVELYRIALEALLQNRDAARRVSRPDLPTLSLSRKMLLLRELAYWLVRNGYTDVPRQLAIEQVQKALTRVSPELGARRVFDGLLQRTGLLREPAEGRVDFIHRTFLEYLAALAVADKDDIGLLVERASEDSWSEIVVLTAGCANRDQRQELVRSLLDRGDDRAVGLTHRYHLLAVACLENAPELDPQLARRIEGALSALLPPRSIAEAKDLAAAGTLAVPLLGPLHGMRAIEAKASIRALGMIGTEDAMEQIAKYGSDGRVTVIRELVKQWSQFDSDDYAQRVMADSPLEGGQLVLDAAMPATVTRHLRNLRNLAVVRPLSGDDAHVIASLALKSVTFGGTASLRSLEEAGSYETLESIRAWSPTELASLAGLGRFSRLEDLLLYRCEAMGSLVANADEWPDTLTELSVTGAGAIDIANISSAKLRTVRLGVEHIEAFEALAAVDTLRQLRLDDLQQDIDLFPLVDNDALELLYLCDCGGHISATPLGAGHNQFHTLYLDGCPTFAEGRGLADFGHVRFVQATSLSGIEPNHFESLDPEVLRLATDVSRIEGFPHSVRAAWLAAPNLTEWDGRGGASLKRLFLSAPKLGDLSVLESFPALEMLYLVNATGDTAPLDALRERGCTVIRPTYEGRGTHLPGWLQAKFVWPPHGNFGMDYLARGL